MNPERFQAITGRYPNLRLAVFGDFCLDRYLEIDPSKAEKSIETGLPVYNVVKVRSQPGGAGTVLNNLVALGVGELYPVGFAGMDGEGFELVQALRHTPRVKLDHFVQTAERRTFTYCKPLLVEPGKPPVELNRLDSKNWTPTPAAIQAQICAAARALAPKVDGFILLEQTDVRETGVITRQLLDTMGDLARQFPNKAMLADSRVGLSNYPPVILKMNAAEFTVLSGLQQPPTFADIAKDAGTLSRRHGKTVFVTGAENGIVGAAPDGSVERVPALPLRGPIDIVGAGDSVTANLTAALAGGANLREAMELAMTASSIVIHQLGTTGTANVQQMAELITSGEGKGK